MNAPLALVCFRRFPAAVLFVIGVVSLFSDARAGEAPASTPTPSAPTGQADPAAPARTPRRDGDFYDRRDGVSNEPPSRPWVLPVFFPPVPPTLGSPVPLPSPLELPAQRAPAALAPHVNEPFYAPLGTRLVEGDLKTRLKEEIDRYLAAKNALLEELRARLASLRSADDATRKEALGALARAQAPRLAALEKNAEEFRAELIRGTFMLSNIDWNVTRSWRVGVSRFHTADDAVNAQYQLVRAAAFYQKGLLPEQRGLLREIAIELKEANTRRGTGNFEGGVGPPLFFSPATARLRLPPGLPASVLEKISRYEREKSAIKHELREAILDGDKAFFAVWRSRAIESLAGRQAPRLVALEGLAEEIRGELARVPNPPGPPPPPPLPFAIAVRIGALIEVRATLRQDILAKIGEIKKTFSILRVIPGRGPSGGSDLRLVLNPGTIGEEKMNALRAALTAFNQEISERQKNAIEEEKAVTDELARIMPRGEPRSAESLLDEYVEIITQREDWLLYDDYRDAMLTPDLSLEQRRLLFDGALQKLVLPLPGWDLSRIRLVQ